MRNHTDESTKEKKRSIERDDEVAKVRRKDSAYEQQ